MNNFHRFQNFEFSVIFKFAFANLIEKATHVTLFWNLSRNLDKISSKVRRKNAKFDEKNETKSEIQYSIAKKCSRFLTKKLRLENGAKECIV